MGGKRGGGPGGAGRGCQGGRGDMGEREARIETEAESEKGHRDMERERMSKVTGNQEVGEQTASGGELC